MQTPIKGLQVSRLMSFFSILYIELLQLVPFVASDVRMWWLQALLGQQTLEISHDFKLADGL